MTVLARKALAGVLAAFTLASCASVQRQPAASSLYVRLGGYEAIAALVDNVLARELRDTLVAPFFKGLEPPDLQRVRQHLVDQLCAAAGGPCFYPGRDMKAVHAEMEITDAVWNAFAGHIGEALTAFRIGERERNELAAFVASLKPDIVHPPAPGGDRG